MRPTTIYALIDLAHDGCVRYVGRTVRPLSVRLKLHRYGNLPCRDWVKQNPETVQIVPLEVVPFEPWAATKAEKRWIERYRMMGHNLFNKWPRNTPALHVEVL